MRLYRLESPMQGSIYSSYMRKLFGKTVWDRQLTHNVHLISCTCLLQAAGILHSWMHHLCKTALIAGKASWCKFLTIQKLQELMMFPGHPKIAIQKLQDLDVVHRDGKNCAWQRQNAAWRLLLLLLLLPVAIADEPIPRPAGLAGQETTQQNHTITLCIADTGA